MLFFILFLPYFSGFTAFFCVGSLSPEGADDSFFLCKELIPDIWTALPVFIRRRFDKDFSPKVKLKLPGQIFG